MRVILNSLLDQLASREDAEKRNKKEPRGETLADEVQELWMSVEGLIHSCGKDSAAPRNVAQIRPLEFVSHEE